MTRPNATMLSRFPTATWPESLTRRAAAVFAGAIGLFLLYAVGFSQPRAIHEAAHDARHAAGFPCH